jgi:hypothetical protein
MPKVPKRVHYRRFEPVNGSWGGETLQSMIASALQRPALSGRIVGDDWSARTLPVPGEPRLKRFAHNITVATSDICGTLCLFSPDDWAPVLIREAAREAEGTHVSLDDALKQVEIRRSNIGLPVDMAGRSRAKRSSAAGPRNACVVEERRVVQGRACVLTPDRRQRSSWRHAGTTKAQGEMNGMEVYRKRRSGPRRQEAGPDGSDSR